MSPALEAGRNIPTALPHWWAQWDTGVVGSQLWALSRRMGETLGGLLQVQGSNPPGMH